MARILETGDAAASRSTTYRLSSGDELWGTLSSADDRDWVKVTLNSNAGYRFRITENDSSGDGLTSGKLQLRDADGLSIGDFDSLLGFNPTITGTYYIDAFASNGNPYWMRNGNYTVDMLAEVAGNARTLATTKANTTYRGTIDYGADHDWIRLTLKKGAGYVFRVVEDDSKGDGLTAGRVQLRDIDGASIGDADGLVAFTAPGTKVHYLDVFAGNSNPYWVRNGNYQLQVVEELAGDARTLGNIDVGTTHRGKIDYGSDHDWLKVTLQKGITYVIRIREDDSKGEGLQSGSVQLRSGNGDSIGAAGAELIYKATKSGTFFLDAFATNGNDFYVKNGLYKLSVVAQGLFKIGTSKADRMDGGPGNDTFYGRGGKDDLRGLAGDDKLYGEAGSDRLEGGRGADKLAGGSGGDRFVFSALSDSTPSKAGRDTILDFSQRQKDRIDLKAIDAKAGTKKDDAFTFIGKSAFSGKAGELRAEKIKKATYVYGDVDGDRKADFGIVLAGKVDLQKSDFIL